jgi:hypothetical protein
VLCGPASPPLLLHIVQELDLCSLADPQLIDRLLAQAQLLKTTLADTQLVEASLP